MLYTLLCQVLEYDFFIFLLFMFDCKSLTEDT